MMTSFRSVVSAALRFGALKILPPAAALFLLSLGAEVKAQALTTSQPLAFQGARPAGGSKATGVIASVVPESTAPLALSRDVVLDPAVMSSAAQATPPSRSMSGKTREFLRRMVAKALTLSPSVQEAQAKRQAAESDVDEAKGQRWPQVQVSAASPSATFGAGTNTSARNAIGNVQVTTPVYDWGRISHAIDSRIEMSNAAGEQLLLERQQVAFETLSSLVELSRNQEVHALSDAYVARMTELVQMLDSIVRADRGRASELTQARARRLQAIVSRDLAAAKVREVQINLVKLIGEEVVLPKDLQWTRDLLDVPEALGAAREHPALRQARAEARAAKLHAQSVRASTRPQLNWVISKSTQQDGLGKEQPWATGVSVQWNVFQGGSGRAAESAAFERALASEQRAMAATRDVEYRLRASASQRDAALNRADEYDALITDSDQVRRIFFEQWYHLGKRTLLDVLTAENDYYNHQVAQASSRYDGEVADLRMRTDAGMLLSWFDGASDVTAPGEVRE